MKVLCVPSFNALQVNSFAVVFFKKMQAQNETAHEWVQYWPVVGGFWIGVNALLSLFFLIVTILSMIFMFKLCYQKGLLNIRTHIVMFGFFTVLSGFVANVVSASCYGLNECRKTVFTFELTGIVMYFNTVLRMVLFWYDCNIEK